MQSIRQSQTCREAGTESHGFQWKQPGCLKDRKAARLIVLWSKLFRTRTVVKMMLYKPQTVMEYKHMRIYFDVRFCHRVVNFLPGGGSRAMS